MLACYKIYIRRTLFLKLKKNFGKSFNGDFFAKTFGADNMILTVNAGKIATAEKNGPRALGTADAWFFPKVECRSCEFWFVCCTAEARLFCAVDAAVSGAEGAVG